MHKRKRKNLVCIGILKVFTSLGLALYVCQANAGGNKIIKWKDDNGITHYSDKLPAQEAGRGNSILSKTGAVIKTNESFNSNNNKVEAEKITKEQLRQDTALLASYSSAEEIDLAKTRNLKSDQLALQELRQRINELKSRIEVGSATYNGKKMPNNVLEDKKTNQSLIQKLQFEIATVERSIAQTKNRYDAYKIRYLELRPREKSLASIYEPKKTLAELENWKADAQARLDAYLRKDLLAKRTGTESSRYIENIKQAKEEIARADEEIATAKGNLKNSEQSFTK